jgi:cysteine rich repeat protein
MKILKALTIAAISLVGSAAMAAAQSGPVATACKNDIPKYCAGKEHGQGEVRACLEANRDKVSPDCKTALDTTGPGQGRQ